MKPACLVALAALLLAAPVLAAPVLAAPVVAAAPLRVETLTLETAAGATLRFHAEIADTPKTRARGLMERPKLAPRSGMLFDFGSTTRVAFWMKNTPEPLDILFLNAEGFVVAIAHETVPFSTASIDPGVPVRAALEIAGGQAKVLGIAPGARARHRIFP